MMDEQKRAYYEQPLQHATPDEIKMERKNQIQLALLCITIGVGMEVLAGLLRMLGAHDSGGSRKGEWWDVVAVGMICIGIYRLLCLKHYITAGLRNNLIQHDRLAAAYDKTVREQKLSRRNAKWYNQSLASDATLMRVLVISLATVLLLVGILTVYAVVSSK